MSDTTNIMAEFVILGEYFSTSEITNRLKIQPTEYYSKGDRIRNRDMFRKESSWSLSTGYEPSLDINIQLAKLLTELENKQRDLVELKQKYNLEYKFFIVIKIEENQSPSIYLNKSTISFANEIEAEFDIDIYVF